MDNDTKLINLALDAGEIMIKNGAETFRVKDTMRRILGTTGRKNIEATALVTLLLAPLPRSSVLCWVFWSTGQTNRKALFPAYFPPRMFCGIYGLRASSPLFWNPCRYHHHWRTDAPVPWGDLLQSHA